MRILVTGATGFIGNKLVEKLKERRDIEIIAIVKKIPKSLEKSSSLRFIEVDISKQNLKELRLDIDVIIHLAASKQHYKNKEKIFADNLKGTENILNSFQNVKHFIFASTSIAEPRSIYSESKFQAENLIKKSNINFTILRIGPVFGVDDDTNISKLIKLIEEGKRFPIPGSGDVEIQPLFIDDLIETIFKIILNETFYRRVVKIAGEPILFKNLIKKICNVTGRKNKSFHIPINFLKFFALIYEKTSTKPMVTKQQIENFRLGSKHNMESDFKVRKLDDSLKKFHEEYLRACNPQKNT